MRSLMRSQLRLGLRTVALLVVTVGLWPVLFATVPPLRTRVGHAKVKGRDVFTREIGIDGDLDESQRHRLLEIAEKCPVHKTLEGGADIETVAEGAPPPPPPPEDACEHMRDMEEACNDGR